MNGKRRISKRAIFIVSAVVLVLALGVGAWYWFVYRPASDEASKDEGSISESLTSASEAEIAAERATGQKAVSELQSKPPAENAASDEKKNYYSNLIIAAHQAGNTGLVISTYEDMQQKGIGFNDVVPIVTAARAYGAQGNKEKAKETLATATDWINANLNTTVKMSDDFSTVDYWRMEVEIASKDMGV